MRRRSCLGCGAAFLLSASLVVTAVAQPHQVNISGATLFANFFTKEASTNDFINVDNDTKFVDPTCLFLNPQDCIEVPNAGFDPCPCFQSGWTVYVDQLAPSFNPPNTCLLPYPPTWWVVNYRGVGSGNGLADLRDFALKGTIPQTPPADFGYINRVKYAELGQIIGIGGCSQGPSGTPTEWAQTSIDLAVMDVPTTWFVTQPGSPAWHRLPTQPGYGNNPRKSWNANQSNKLKSLCDSANPNLCLNVNIANPDDRTVFDTEIAWVPIAFIANRGALPNANTSAIRVSELQHLFVTGRLPNGRNPIAATRDAGSGTRNGAMNSIGVDPSWGIGDNLGLKQENAKLTLLGNHFLPTHCGGSGIIEDVVKNHRLAIGYTGLAGSSRAVGDALAGRYEILDVIFDDRGGTMPVRPKINTVLDNCDPNYGYAVGGNETFASVGDPFETDPNSPAYMNNQAAADYLRNMVASINATVAVPGGSESYFMPGELLAKEYFLTAALDCLPDPLNPTSLIPNANLNQPLQDWIRANNGLGVGGDTPAFGSVNVANKVPVRAKASDYTCAGGFDPPGIVWPDDPNPPLCDPNTPWTPKPQCDCPYPPRGFYSDGTDGTVGYVNRQGGANLAYGANLNLRNRIAGDFNGDSVCSIDDIPAMMLAIYDVAQFVAADQAAGYSSATNPVVVEIIGDFNGDGNFDCRDVRYFCDGLALDPTTGKLRRWEAFKRVDDAWFALTGDDNYFNTTIYDRNGNPRPWVRGAAAADVAGAALVAPGAAPIGYDCRVNCTDVRYIDTHFGDWADLNQAALMDLSADVNDDLKVDCRDVFWVEWLMGSFCTGLTSPCGYCKGDVNGDGWVNFGDINPFVQYLSNPQGWFNNYPDANPANADINEDGFVNFADINPFVSLLSSGGGQPIPCQ